MASRLHLGALLGFAIGAWMVLLWLRGFPVTWDLVWPYGLVLSFLVLAVGAFETWGWRYRRLRHWFVQRPDIRGTWRVLLKSDYVDPGTGKRMAPIVCYIVVRQTLTTLNMRLMTRESDSWVEAHKFVRHNDGVYQLACVYTNEPRLDHRHHSEIHHGSMLLNVQGDPPHTLEGHYWTDRGTRGSMLLTDRTSTLYDRFDDARAAMGDGSVTEATHAVIEVG